MPELKRAVTLTDGTAMVVTDLHGNLPVYEHVRDNFLRAHAAGTVQQLVLCGDLIHGNGAPADDASLPMLLDVMRLQGEMGENTVILLCGNHELPHIYGMTLSRGDKEYTPGFEAALTALDQDSSSTYSRADAVNFLAELPFYVFTAAGVMLAHAGPVKEILLEQDAVHVLQFDHGAFLARIDAQLAQYDLDHARQLYATKAGGDDYASLAKHFLAVTDENDPRYNHLLRSFIWSGDPEFELLWNTLFTRNENEFPNDMRRAIDYANVVRHFLKLMSARVPAYPQHVIVSGHIVVDGGHQVVDDYHLRLASHEHARPQPDGQILLLDCATEVRDADALVPHLRRTLDDL